MDSRSRAYNDGQEDKMTTLNGIFTGNAAKQRAEAYAKQNGLKVVKYDYAYKVVAEDHTSRLPGPVYVTCKRANSKIVVSNFVAEMEN